MEELAMRVCEYLRILTNGLLRTSCESGDIEGVRCALTSPDVDVNQQTATQRKTTPLHVAAGSGYENICRLLLEHSNINRYAVDGIAKFQPIHYAASQGNINIIKLFIGDKSLTSLAKEEKEAIGKFICLNCGTETQEKLLSYSEYTATEKILLFCHFLRGGHYTDQLYTASPENRQLLFSLTEKNTFGLSTLLQKLFRSMDRYLQNSKEITDFAREAFEAHPTSLSHMAVLVHADMLTCTSLTRIAFQCCNLEDKLRICTWYFTYLNREVSGAFSEVDMQFLDVICNHFLQSNPIANYSKDDLKRLKQTFKKIDHKDEDTVRLLLGSSYTEDKSVSFGLRNSFSKLLQQRTLKIDAREFRCYARDGCLQNLDMFLSLCKHSSNIFCAKECHEFATIRHQYLQSSKDNYCISKYESINASDDEIVLEVTKIIDEVKHVNFQSETADIKQSLFDIFTEVGKTIHMPFTPQIVGSSHEGTRNYLPNEYDILCIFDEYPVNVSEDKVLDFTVKTDLNIAQINEQFYQAVASRLRFLESDSHSSLLYTPDSRSNHYYGHIKNFTFIWTGLNSAGLIIDVDIVPVLRCTMMDTTREILNQPESQMLLTTKLTTLLGVSDKLLMCVSHTESSFIRQLPTEIRNGYKIAKALLSARVFSDDVVKHFNMASDLPLDKYIRTYWLKNCLLLALKHHNMLTTENQALNKEDELYWTDEIFRLLEEFLTEKELPWFFNKADRHKLFHCPHVPFRLNTGCGIRCCLRRKFLLKVVTWIRYLIASVRAAEENQSVVGKVLVYSRDTMEHPYDFYNIYKKHAQPASASSEA